MIRVTVWNEYEHERNEERVAKVYPKGIHGAIADFLGTEEDIEVRTATLDQPENGLTQEVLDNTDVLVWWGHMAHHKVLDEVAMRVKNRVLDGMGFIALHSAHYSKIMKALMGTTMSLNWRNNDSETLQCVKPLHPIANGVPSVIDIPHEEMYSEWFDIPKPDDIVFEGTFSRGEKFRSGVTFTRGYGKIFYFQPGHEEYPIYFMPEIQRIITNAVHWAYSPDAPRKLPECHEIK